MRLDGGPTDRKSHADSLRLRREKCLEQLVRIAWRQTHTRIANRDQHAATVRQLRFDGKFATGGGRGESWER